MATDTCHSLTATASLPRAIATCMCGGAVWVGLCVREGTGARRKWVYVSHTGDLLPSIAFLCSLFLHPLSRGTCRRVLEGSGLELLEAVGELHIQSIDILCSLAGLTCSVRSF